MSKAVTVVTLTAAVI